MEPFTQKCGCQTVWLGNTLLILISEACLSTLLAIINISLPILFFLDYLATDNNKGVRGGTACSEDLNQGKASESYPIITAALFEWSLLFLGKEAQGPGSKILIYCATSLSVPFFSVPITRLLFKLATPHHIHTATCSSYILISLVHILARVMGLIGDCFTS